MSLVKKDIVFNISKKAHIPTKLGAQLLDKFILTIKVQSITSKIKITSFGTFFNRYSPQRIGRNPNTKKEYIIPKILKLYFSPSNKIKNIIN